MKVYVVYKDIVKIGDCTSNDETLTSKNPYFILNNFSLIDENTANAMLKLKNSINAKFKKFNGKELDEFRLETMDEEDFNKIREEIEKKHNFYIPVGSLDNLVDYYVGEMGYNYYDEMCYGEAKKEMEKKRKMR